VLDEVSGGSTGRHPKERTCPELRESHGSRSAWRRFLLVSLGGVTGVAAQPTGEVPGQASDSPWASADPGDIGVNLLPSEPEFVPDELAVTLQPGHESTQISNLLDTEVDVRDERPFGKRNRGVTVDPAELDKARELLSANPAVARVERVPVPEAELRVAHVPGASHR
jgi:hypothetical protein